MGKREHGYRLTERKLTSLASRSEEKSPFQKPRNEITVKSFIAIEKSPSELIRFCGSLMPLSAPQGPDEKNKHYFLGGWICSVADDAFVTSIGFSQSVRPSEL